MSEIEKKDSRILDDRRQFLADLGKFAVTVPPTMTILLSTSLVSPALAASGGGTKTKGDNGGGKGLDQHSPSDPRINDGLGQTPGKGKGNGGADSNSKGKSDGNGNQYGSGKD